MLSFPDIVGPYEVGATTFALPLLSPSVIGSAKLRHGIEEGLRPALKLEEVAFTAFYPADISESTGFQKSSKGIDWLVRPVSTSLRAYAHFRNLSIVYTWLLWPLMYLFAQVKIPVYCNAPLLNPTGTSVNGLKSNVRQWPLVIFSHGLGGNRTVYSQLCSRIAASGKVVLAMEHRDGTSYACVIRSPSGEMITKLYVRNDEVIWEAGTPSESGTLPFRTDQLLFRRHEIYLAYSALSSLVKHSHTPEIPRLQTIDGSNIQWESWFKSRPEDLPLVDCDDNIALVGHSFGGATVLSILSNPPPTNEYAPIPVTHALILDPWLEPLPSPGPAPYPSQYSGLNPELTTSSTDSSSDAILQEKNSDLSKLPRMLVLNSDPFTLWKEHFARLKEVVEAWEPEGRRVLTLVRAEHVSFSDFPLLPILRRASAEILMDIISKLSLGFLDGNIDDTLDTVRTRKMEIKVIGKKKDGKPKRRCIGEAGDVIIH